MDGKGEGMIGVADALKASSPAAVKALQKLGIEVIMLTGDNQQTAEAIAQQTNQGYTTQNSWMVGDTEADVIAAKQMGLPSAALSCGVRSADYLKALEPTSLHDGLLSAAQTVVNNQQLQAA